MLLQPDSSWAASIDLELDAVHTALRGQSLQCLKARCLVTKSAPNYRFLCS